ncbi:MAG: U32 family peptidase, partial [Muribaculaceae bacterium]|nr:U32 family peptidase [Muribaculaceae bacterium]
ICRRSYRLTDQETGQEIVVDDKYLLSPKDLKTLAFLDQMVQAGVTVFKIEGRARGPEYVTEVVKAYDSALRMIADGNFSAQALEPLEERLKMVFNRGFWDGYYLDRGPGEWSRKYGSSATRVKVYAAKAIRYFSKLGVAEFKLEAGELNLGDEILIIGPTTGSLNLTLTEMRVDLKPVERVEKGQHFSIAVPEKIRPSDRLYLWRETGVGKTGQPCADCPPNNQ